MDMEAPTFGNLSTLGSKYAYDSIRLLNLSCPSEQVTRAYDQIKRTGLADDGEIASYASLGGTGRNSLSEPINMTSQSMQAKLPADVQVAVRPLDSEIINRFLARSCARHATAVAV